MTDTRRGIPEHDFASHEHAEMRRGIEGITEAARLQVSNDELTMAALEILHWVDHVLEPHAQWEDSGSIRRSTNARAHGGRPS